MPSPKKYWRELLGHLPPGYKIDYQHQAADDANKQAKRRIGKHPVVYRPDGTVVRAEDGRPVIVSTTPSGPWSIKNDLKGLQRAGVKVR